jgi:alpha-glucosidase
MVLFAKIGEYGVIARRKGEEWFIGGINGEKAIELDINLAFLTPCINYSAKIYSDDPSVNTRTHVRKDSIDIDKNTIYTASLAANNGIAIHIVPVK